MLRAVISIQALLVRRASVLSIVPTTDRAAITVPRECYRNNTTVPRECYRNNTTVPRECYRNNTNVPRECYRNNTTVPRECYRNNYWKLIMFNDYF